MGSLKAQMALPVNDSEDEIWWRGRIWGDSGKVQYINRSVFSIFSGYVFHCTAIHKNKKLEWRKFKSILLELQWRAKLLKAEMKHPAKYFKGLSQRAASTIWWSSLNTSCSGVVLLQNSKYSVHLCFCVERLLFPYISQAVGYQTNERDHGIYAGSCIRIPEIGIKSWRCHWLLFKIMVFVVC